MKLHEIIDEQPLIFTLTDRLIQKGEKVYMQRTKGSKQALYPMLAIECRKFGSEDPYLSITINEVVPTRSGAFMRPKDIEIEANIADMRWSLTKDDGHWVFHVMNTPVTKNLDSKHEAS